MERGDVRVGSLQQFNGTVLEVDGLGAAVERTDTHLHSGIEEIHVERLKSVLQKETIKETYLIESDAPLVTSVWHSRGGPLPETDVLPEQGVVGAVVVYDEDIVCRSLVEGNYSRNRVNLRQLKGFDHKVHLKEKGGMEGGDGIPLS